MSPSSTPTRDRLVDEAMRLFGEQGFRGTSVAQIEEAAGLSPGAGGLYHHFESKTEVLEAGIARHLDRLAALRDIRDVLTPLGDTRTELTVMARYVLAELDREDELFRVVITEARRRPQLLTDAMDQLVGSTFADFVSWLEAQCDGALDRTEAASAAAVGLGALLWSRLQRSLLGISSIAVEDEALVETWVRMMLAVIEPR